MWSVVNVRGLAGVWEGGEWTSVGLGRYIRGTAFMYSGEKTPGWSLLTGEHLESQIPEQAFQCGA